MRNVMLLTVALVVVAAGASLVGWSIGVVSTPAKTPDAIQPFSRYTAEIGAVESSIALSATASWPMRTLGANLATGTVTSIDHESGALADTGDLLYSVNLRPVFLAEGEVPAFRPLGLGSEGEDVEQLQSFLHDVGVYNGSVDGEIGPRTVAAVKKWQDLSGVEESGLVEVGDIVFAPGLPTRVVLDDESISVGSFLSGGESAISGSEAEPKFEMLVSPEQARLIPSGAQATIRVGDSAWAASVGSFSSEESGVVSFELVSATPGPICAEACDQVPVEGTTSFPIDIVLQPRVEGVLVPIAAIKTGVNGSSTVMSSAGSTIAISILASAKGMAVVDGLSAGTEVRVAGQ